MLYDFIEIYLLSLFIFHFVSKKVYYNEIFSDLFPALLTLFNVTLGSSKSLDCFAGVLSGKSWESLSREALSALWSLMHDPRCYEIKDMSFIALWLWEELVFLNIKCIAACPGNMLWSCSVSRNDRAFVQPNQLHFTVGRKLRSLVF